MTVNIIKESIEKVSQSLKQYRNRVFLSCLLAFLTSLFLNPESSMFFIYVACYFFCIVDSVLALYGMKKCTTELKRLDGVMKDKEGLLDE